MECDVRTPNLRLEPRVCVSSVVQTRENVTCEVCCSQSVTGPYAPVRNWRSAVRQSKTPNQPHDGVDRDNVWNRR